MSEFVASMPYRCGTSISMVYEIDENGNYMLLHCDVFIPGMVGPVCLASLSSLEEALTHLDYYIQRLAVAVTEIEEELYRSHNRSSGMSP